RWRRWLRSGELPRPVASSRTRTARPMVTAVVASERARNITGSGSAAALPDPASVAPNLGQLVQLDAPVRGAPGGRRVRTHRAPRAVAAREHAGGTHALAGEVRTDRRGSRLREPQVDADRARVVGVARDLDPDLRIGEQRG